VKTAKLLKKIIKKHTLPVTVQLIDTKGHDIKLTGKMVPLRGDVKLRLLKEYEEKYIYGNPVKTGIYAQVALFPWMTNISHICGMKIRYQHILCWTLPL
jgi:hypothetical protein